MRPAWGRPAAPHRPLHETPCEFCQTMVLSVEDYLDDPDTQLMITDFLDSNLCSALPAEVTDLCKQVRVCSGPGRCSVGGCRGQQQQVCSQRQARRWAPCRGGHGGGLVPGVWMLPARRKVPGKLPRRLPRPMPLGLSCLLLPSHLPPSAMRAAGGARAAGGRCAGRPWRRHPRGRLRAGRRLHAVPGTPLPPW